MEEEGIRVSEVRRGDNPRRSVSTSSEECGMANELIINVTPHETRVGLLEDRVLAELYVERAKDRASSAISIKERS